MASEALIDAIDGYLDHLMNQRRASEHTVAAYQRDLMQAVEFFTKTGLAEWSGLDEALVHRYQATLGPPLAVSTRRRKLSSLRSLLKYLQRYGSSGEVVAFSARNAGKARHLPKALSLADLSSLLSAASDSTPEGVRDRTLLELIYGTGLRISEALGIGMEEVNLDEAMLRVTGKRGKVRHVPIPRETMAVLENYLANARPKLASRAGLPLIVSDRGNRMNRSVAYERIRHYAALAGIETKIGPHTLRHSYAVHLLQGGADLRNVQELLGHASINTTQVYTHLDVDHMRGNYRAAHPRK